MIQDLCWCEVADEPVVVIKAQPKKAGNGVEDKTKPTISCMSNRVSLGQNLGSIAKGRSTL